MTDAEAGPGRLVVVAERAARAGGGVLLDRFGAPAGGVAAKSSRTDLVSDADRAAEAAVLEVLRAERPGDAIVAEEGGGTEGESGVRWLVDPLDGTINYLWGIPHWCVSVAALAGDEALAGVVHDPLRGETFRAARGAGAFLGTERLRRGAPPPPAEALVATGFHYRPEERARQAERVPALLGEVRDLRRFGAAALDLAWVACGRLDGYLETGLSAWDVAAGALLVAEAGGAVHRLAPREGRPGGIVAAPAPLDATLAALVYEATEGAG